VNRPANGLFADDAYVEEERRAPADPLTSLRAELRGEMRAMKVTLGRQSTPATGSASTAHVLQMAEELAAMRAAVEDLALPFTDALGGGSKKNDRHHPILKSSGIEGYAAAKINRSFRKADAKDNPEDAFCEGLARVVKFTAWPLADEGPAVIAMVGPTGVGKTTTLAKIAAYALGQGRSVTLVTCDTFRVGGIEQTRRYADLLDIPWAAVKDASELSRAIALADTDLVLVDTSGRAPEGEAAECLLSEVAFTEAVAEHGYSRHVLLCMTASVRASDATRIARSFAVADPTAICITKIDETDAPSGLVHAAHAARLPLSVLTAGQRVPEDLSPATMGAVFDAFTRTAARKSAPAATPKAKAQ
jgi:flagellar biosynthesis protein FlhF